MTKEAFPWEDMDPDVMECGDPAATHALYVKALRARAAQSRKISHEQQQAAVDCLEGHRTFAAHARDFDALADALEKASVTFSAIAMEARKGPDRETGLGGEAATARACKASPDV